MALGAGITQKGWRKKALHDGLAARYTSLMAGRPWHPRCALAVATMALGSTQQNARAGDSAALVNLQWVAPAGCPDAAHVTREVERLRPDVSPKEEPDLSARAEVREEKSGRWHVEIRTEGRQGAGTRTVTAESCEALADATALILALALPGAPATVDAGQAPAVPDAARSEPNPPSGREPRRVAAVLPPSGAVGAERSAFPGSSPSRIVRVAVVVSALVDTGTLPGAAFGAGMRIALIPEGFSALRVEVGGGLFVDQSTANPPSRSGSFSLRTIDAGACLIAPVQRLEIGPCAGVELASVSANGLRETVTDSVDAAWVVPRARATVAYFGSQWWSVRADVGIGVDLNRPEFVSLGAGQGLIHQPARYTGRGGLGLELRF